MKILVPIDRSHRDGVVLPYSTTAARAFGASITVVHVLPARKAIMPGALKEAEAYASAVSAGLRESGIETESIVRRGDPATTIVVVVEETKADLIVMASRGRSGIGKMMLGSVGDAVLTNCGKPVLLLNESVPTILSDENVRKQSAYLATVIWNRQVRGLCTPEEAQIELATLAASGLNRDVLISSYEGLVEVGGTPFDWLDIDFQVNTLRQFLPQEVNGTLQSDGISAADTAADAAAEEQAA